MNQYKAYRIRANGARFDHHEIWAEDLSKAWLAALDLWGRDYPEARLYVAKVMS